ncbi:tRNA pseudouridine(55) synthase TruB [uncultured Bifidobacterium sp.]|uniref:tRNA pseudouridine(55) synthase TruB n=1 Tax=uncultured Bifidobacterium sp. TaxID=165187 RepID=UPI00262F290F|nr:tRNA pseudouridine(55) synthase TruB [uncultured Bifidobacterium sp.]
MNGAEGGSAGLESGIVLVDKPRGVTSHDVVSALRSVMGTRQVGHGGTLDPLATGLLIVGFGKATRLLSYVIGSAKTYEATIRLGVATTTDDLEGERMDLGPARRDVETITRDELIGLVSRSYVGEIQQVPSRYSAVRIDGRHAYELARKGTDFTIEPRTVTIHRFDVGGCRRSTACFEEGASAVDVLDVDVRITCSSGTYIRSIARDMGQDLAVGGHLTALRRVSVGEFDVADAHTERARAVERTITRRDGSRRTVLSARFDDPETVRGHAISMSDAARKVLPVVSISSDDAERLRYGKRIDIAVRGSTAAIHTGGSGSDTVDDLVAIIEPSGARESRPTVVFPDRG